MLFESYPARRSIVDAVPPDCTCSYTDVLHSLNRALTARGSPIEDLECGQMACNVEEHDASTDESDVADGLLNERC